MPLVCVVVRFWTSKNGEKKTTDKQTDMATSGTEKDKNTKHAQIKSAVQKTEKNMTDEQTDMQQSWFSGTV